MDDDKILPLEVISKKYHGIIFENKPFSKKANISDSKYIRCVFRNVEFEKLTLSNIIFEDCLFEDCNFFNTRVAYLSFLEFRRCKLENIKINKCSLFSLHIRWSNLEKVDFIDTYMKGCNLVGNSYREVRFIDDCNLMDSSITDINSCMEIKFINEKSYTKLNYGSYIDKFKYEKINDVSKKATCDYRESNKQLYLNVSYTYMDFGEQYLRNHISGKYGKCFYESKIAFHKTLKGIERIKSNIYNLVCGYGEKPHRSFIISLIIILIFSVMYLVVGIKHENEIIDIYSLKTNPIRTIVYGIYFSTVTFSTVGYGDLVCCGTRGALIATIEILLGVVMVGIWTSTLVKKMTR